MKVNLLFTFVSQSRIQLHVMSCCKMLFYVITGNIVQHMPTEPPTSQPEGVLPFSHTILRSASFTVSVFQLKKPEILDVAVVRTPL